MNELHISLAALRNNYAALQKQFAGECGAVVKANGYGLGAAQIAQALDEGGCNLFFVATLEEGIELRKTTKKDIYVFHGVQTNEQKELEEHNLIPVINNDAQLKNWDNSKPAALHFDTGMTRLGFDPEKALELSNLPNLRMVMSHLASSDEIASPQNAVQLKLFKQVAEYFPAAKKSLCNSYGIYLNNSYHFDVARPGIALYGGNPTPAAPNPMLPVVFINAPIIQITEITKNKTVGYGADYMAYKGDVIATLPMGYADGIFRNLGNLSNFYSEGHKLPVVGRISMDLITIKINNLPPVLRKIGQMVEILGNNYTICDMARDAKTIEYEVITCLGHRFKRIYK